MKLNLIQTQQVADFLHTYTCLSTAVQEELLDHLCCGIEDAMRRGSTFEEAFAAARGRWNEDEVRKIHSSTQNQSFMIKLFLAASLAALFTLSPWTLSEEPAPAIASLTTEGCDMSSDPPRTCPLAAAACSSHHGFGMRIHPITKAEVLHRGVDYRASMGTPVQAAGRGTVVEAGEQGAYGYCILIRHDDIYHTRYAHLSKIDVQVGDELDAGATIGAVGSTGASTGPHLHFEILVDGEPVDPAMYIP